MNDPSQVRRLEVRGVPSFVRVGPRSVSLGRDEDVLNWDRAGRPFAGNLEGVTWHRALDGGLVRIDTEPAGGRRATWLAPDDVTRWSETLRGWAAAVRDAARAAGDEDAARAFEPAAAFGPERWSRDASGFAEVYSPVPILPPDQYLALVLQATLGCSWNRCTFCNFYRNRRYAVRPAAEFREHARAVRAFMGAGLAARRTIFLGDANAIAAPAGRVLEWLDVVRELFPLRGAESAGPAPAAAAAPIPAPNDPPGGFDGVHAFLDVPGGLAHTQGDWEAFAERGLRTLYLGVETGNDALLARLRKRGGAAAARELVPRLKRAGLSVGLIFLAGIARDAGEAAAHERDSAALVAQLPLDRGDLVYVSPCLENDADGERAERGEPSPEAWDQARRMKDTIAPRGSSGPRAGIYDIRLFAY